MRSKSVRAEVEQAIRAGTGEKLGTIRLDASILRGLTREHEGFEYLSADDLINAISRAVRAAAKRTSHLPYDVGYGIPVENARKLLLSILGFRSSQKDLSAADSGETQTEDEMQSLIVASKEAAKVAQAIQDHVMRNGEAPHWEDVQDLLAHVPNRPMVESILWHAKDDDPTIALADRSQFPEIAPPPRDLSSKQIHTVLLTVNGVVDPKGVAEVVIDKVAVTGGLETGSTCNAISGLIGHPVELKFDDDQEKERDLLVAAQFNRSAVEAHISVKRGMRPKDLHRAKLHVTSLIPRADLLAEVKLRMEQMALDFEAGSQGAPSQ